MLRMLTCCIMIIFGHLAINADESDPDPKTVCCEEATHDGKVLTQQIKYIWSKYYVPNAQFPCLQAYLSYCAGLVSGHGVFIDASEFEALNEEFEEGDTEHLIEVGAHSQGLLKFMLGVLLSKFIHPNMQTWSTNMLTESFTEMFEQ